MTRGLGAPYVIWISKTTKVALRPRHALLTAAVLDGRFARVCTIAEALAGAPRAAAA